MRTLLLAGVLAVAGFAIATPISIAPASAQVAVDTPLGGVRVGPQPRYDRDYDRPAYRAYGYDRGYRGCPAPSRSSATTVRSAGSAVATSSTGLVEPGAHKSVEPALAIKELGSIH